VEARKFVLDHPPHMGRKHCAAVLKFSITVSMLDLGVTKRKHQVLPEYKLFIHKMLT
jgi:hypothetical protein